MENPTRFDLNAAIRHWQQELAASSAVGADDLEELASHLRVSVQRLQGTGLSEAESFLVASRRLGAVDDLSREFTKVNRALLWRERAFWMLAGTLAYLGATDFSNLISNTSMALCSTFLPNGYWLACIGFAAWLSAVVLLVILFRLVAVGRLTGITAAMTWLLQRRWTAVAVLFGGAVALRATNGLGMVTLLTRILPHTTIMQVVQIKSLSNPVESLALLMIIVVGLTKAASSMRTSKCRT